MRRAYASRAFAGLATLALVLGACTSGASQSPSAASPSAPASDPASAEPSATQRVGPPEGQAKKFIVAETAFGIGSVAFKEAIEVLNSQGYEIETPILDASELVSQGVASGQFAFGSGANSSALLAMEAGGPMKFIVDRNSNEWTIVSTKDVTDCKELVASRVAIHSPGSVSGAMLRDWINNTCPDVADNYEPLIIAGSQNRAAALLADQIDAAPAELRDWISLDETGEGRFHLLVNFAGDLPDLHPTSMYGNIEFMEANPDVTTDLVREILNQNRRINEEDGYLLSLYKKYLPDEVSENEALAKLVTDTYVELGLFDGNGGITEANLDYTAKFFGPNGTGDLKAEMPVSDIADLSFIEAALEQIGRH